MSYHAVAADKTLFYMAPFKNVINILFSGIYSYNGVGNRDDIVRIADPVVQELRENRNIGIEGYEDKTIHDFVPLYFATHTPMQYVVTKDDFENQSERIIFITFSMNYLCNSGNYEHILISDGNASSKRSQLYSDIDEGLGNIDWDRIRCKKCYSREYRRQKAAELLVLDWIDCRHIKEIIVMDKDTAESMSACYNACCEELDREPMEFAVRPDIECFYYYDEEGNLRPI